MQLIIVLLAGLAATAKPTPRPPAPTTSLRCEQAVAYAVVHNPSFRALRAQALVALQRLNASRIFPTNPMLESMGKGKAKGTKFSPYRFEVALTWKFPIGGRWTRRQHIAKAIYLRVKAEIHAAQLSMVLKTQKVCYGLVLAQEKVLLYKSVLGFYKRALKYAKKRKTSGDSTLIDFNLARLEWLQAKAALTLAIAERRAKLRELVVVLGWTKKKPPQVKDRSLFTLRLKYSLPQLLQQSQTQHVMLQLLQRRIDEYKAKYKWAQAKAIPDLKIKLFYAFEEGENHIMGGGLSIPLPLLWRQQTKVWTGKAKLQQSRLKLRAAKFKIPQHIHKAYIQFMAGWRVFQLYETQLIPTIQAQLKLRARGLRLGSFTILQVISAQQSQNKALLKRISSLKLLLDSYIALQTSLGKRLQ